MGKRSGAGVIVLPGGRQGHRSRHIYGMPVIRQLERLPKVEHVCRDKLGVLFRDIIGSSSDSARVRIGSLIARIERDYACKCRYDKSANCSDRHDSGKDLSYPRHQGHAEP